MREFSLHLNDIIEGDAIDIFSIGEQKAITHRLDVFVLLAVGFGHLGCLVIKCLNARVYRGIENRFDTTENLNTFNTTHASKT